MPAGPEIVQQGSTSRADFSTGTTESTEAPVSDSRAAVPSGRSGPPAASFDVRELASGAGVEDRTG